jgi:CRISPR/Cas system-associated protein Cas5 (RAMP superfamily)
MYYVQLDIRPTGGLTFRRMPSSILHISTYPFLPPSTMSGYLRRLLMLGAGRYPNTTVGDAPYYVLPWPLYHVLGAYPTPRRAYRVHITRRHGPKYQAKHTAFSKLVRVRPDKARERNEQQLQLHTWEYLFVDRMRGYVASEEIEALEKLRSVVNLGSKLGKEGYAYVECISEVLPMERKTASAIPSVLTPASELVGEPADFVFLYRHEHTGEIPLEALADDTPSPVAGFVPFWGGWPAEPVMLDYWTSGQVFIPVSLLEVL